MNEITMMVLASDHRRELEAQAARSRLARSARRDPETARQGFSTGQVDRDRLAQDRLGQGRRSLLALLGLVRRPA